MQENNALSLRKELELLSIADLDNMLQEELHKEDASPEKVRLILAVLQEREKDIPIEVTAAEQAAWQRFLSHKAASSDKPAKKPNWMLSAASIAVVLGLLLATVSYEVGAEGVWGRLVRWTDSVIEFFSPEVSSGGQQEYVFQTDHPGLQQVYDAVTRMGVTEPVVPMWIPEGYSLVRCKEMSNEKKTTLMVVLQNGEKVINYNVAVYSESVLNQYQKDDTNVRVVEMGGIDHYIIRNYSMWVAIWTKENIECSISIECQEEEFFQILQSIYDKEEAI